MFIKILTAIALLASFGLGASPFSPAQSRFELGGNVNIQNTFGEPFNDMNGYGITARFVFDNNFFVGLGRDSIPEADFEEPSKRVGINDSEKVVDSKFSSRLITIHLGAYAGNAGSKWNWYWLVGYGMNEVSFTHAAGSRTGGGSYHIVPTSDNESVLLISAGYIHRVSSLFSLNYQFRIDRHFAAWRLEDTVSGNTGIVNDYTALGISVGILF